YSEDDFRKPNPFKPDVVVPIDPVFDQKVTAIDAIESQFYEWNPWLAGYLDEVPKGRAERLNWLEGRLAKRYGATAEKYRGKLVELLGDSRGRAVKAAEAFEVCEYGAQPTRERLLELFPFFTGE